MASKSNILILVAALCQSMSASASEVRSRVPHLQPAPDISHRPSDYSNGYGTNEANSEAVGVPVNRYGGYVVNQYGFGNYVSGPEGFGGYPAGSAGAEIWRQRERWKCENAPESC